jgi:hypothetical protein
MPSKKSDHHRAFDVFLAGKEIDTVFYAKRDNITEGEVRDSLVNHDGYDSRIVVKEVK